MSNSALMIFLQAEKQGRYGIPITFPATPYQLLDVKDRARVQEGDRLRCEVSHFEPFTFIFAFIEESPCPEQMIALAQRLSQLDETGQIAFEGLVAKEKAMGLGENPLERLITLAYNTDDCDVYPGICHHEDLGHHYVDNGQYTPAKDIPEELLPMLNYEVIGKTMSDAERGILTPKGYVIPPSELKEVPWNTPIIPDYAILLELSLAEHKTQLKLPSSPAEMDSALDRIGAERWSGVGLRCLDCAAPTLVPHISSRNNIAHINRLAQQLWTMKDTELPKFKAVLDATKEHSVLGATHIALHLDEYLFSPQYIMPEDVAVEALSIAVGTSQVRSLLKHTDLRSYGRELIRQEKAFLTDYGLVAREDGQSLKPSPTQESQPEMNEMT